MSLPLLSDCGNHIVLAWDGCQGNISTYSLSTQATDYIKPGDKDVEGADVGTCSAENWNCFCHIHLCGHMSLWTLFSACSPPLSPLSPNRVSEWNTPVGSWHWFSTATILPFLLPTSSSLLWNKKTCHSFLSLCSAPPCLGVVVSVFFKGLWFLCPTQWYWSHSFQLLIYRSFWTFI